MQAIYFKLNVCFLKYTFNWTKQTNLYVPTRTCCGEDVSSCTNFKCGRVLGCWLWCLGVCLVEKSVHIAHLKQVMVGQFLIFWLTPSPSAPFLLLWHGIRARCPRQAHCSLLPPPHPVVVTDPCSLAETAAAVPSARFCSGKPLAICFALSGSQLSQLILRWISVHYCRFFFSRADPPWKLLQLQSPLCSYPALISALL